MKTVMTVSGIRPDFIRMSHVFKRLDADPEIHHILVHSGQHYDKLMSDVFFDELEIRKPDYNLQIGAPGKTHYDQLGDLTSKLLNLIKDEELNPDVIVFLGDSNSAGVAFPLKKEGYTIAHIEAGMRSGDKRMLEEINRTVCDHCSDFHFVYHENYKEKLLKENLPEQNIFVVGNTIVEPLKEMIAKHPKRTLISEPKTTILVDIHRPENFKYENRLRNIVNYIKSCCSRYNCTAEMLEFPRTMQALENFNIELPDCIKTVPLKSYVEFIHAMRDCNFMISDSGTAQEEPALLGTQVIVPRDFTERPESIKNNCSYMLDVNTACKSWSNSYKWIEHGSPYMSADWLGDGTTSQKIIDILKKVL